MEESGSTMERLSWIDKYDLLLSASGLFTVNKTRNYYIAVEVNMCAVIYAHQLE